MASIRARNNIAGTLGTAVLIVQIVLFFWYVYFTIKVAAHVGAWPFG